jgi:hypothetical protein
MILPRLERLARSERALRFSCWMTLVGLGLFVWSVLDPRPMPVMVAMSIGQMIGSAAFALYVLVIGVEFIRAERKKTGGKR